MDNDPGDVGIAGDSLGTKYRKIGTEADKAYHVPVNEDYLFDVDVERRELAPAYWLGPVYDVRRGTWFFQGTLISTLCNKHALIGNNRGSDIEALRREPCHSTRRRLPEVEGLEIS